MGYQRDWAKKQDASSVTTHTAAMPTHESGDVLAWVCYKFGTTGSYSTPSGGWVKWHENTRLCIYTKVAASSSETAPSITISSSTIISYMVSLVDIDVADIINQINSTTESGPRITTGISVTTDEDDCFLLAICGVPSSNAWPVSGPGPVFIDSDQAGSQCLGIAWDFQKTAGSTPVHKWHLRSNPSCHVAVIAFNNATNGRIPGYVDPSTSLGEIITDLSTTTTLAGVSFTGTVHINALGSLSLTYDAAAAVAGGANPNNSMLSNTPGSGTVSGFEIAFASPTGPLDLSSGRVAFSYIARDPQDGAVDLGSVNQGGAFVAFMDGNDYRAFHYTARDSSPNPIGRQIAVIDVTQSDTDYAESGTPNMASVDSIVFVANAAGGDMPQGLGISELHKVNTLHIAGGTTANPLDVDAVATLGTSFRLPIIQKSGAGGLLAQVPIKVGGGDPVKLELNGFALQWPRSYSVATKQISLHVSANSNKWTDAAALTADMVKLTNGVMGSPTAWDFEITSGATSIPTRDFSGLTQFGPGITTLRNVMTFTGMTFSERTTITTANACSLASCTLVETANTPDFTGDTLTNITITPVNNGTCALIDTSTTISGLTLNANGSSSFGLEIDEVGTYDLTDGVTWSGFSAGRLVNVTNSGTSTITLNAGGTLDIDDVTTAGAPVVFDVSTTTVRHLTLADGVRYQLYNVTQDTELANTTVSGGSGFTYTTQSAIATNDVLRLRATSINGATSWSSLEATAIATAGGTTDFGASSLSADSTYASYAIDGSGVTEFSTDYVNTEVDVSDGDHVTTKKRLYAWLKYIQTTEDGIANWWGAVTALDDANIRVNASVVDLTIENNGAQVVRFTDTDIYFYRDDGATIAASTGTGIIWESGKVYIAETGVSGLTPSESALLSGAATANALATVDGIVDAVLAKLTEMHELAGLDNTKPLTVTPTARTVGDISQSISTASGTTTVTRAA